MYSGHSLPKSQTCKFLLDLFPPAGISGGRELFSQRHKPFFLSLASVDSCFNQLDQHLISAKPPIACDLTHLFRDGRW